MDNQTSKKTFLHDFNESRTNFWVSVGFLLIESIIPGIVYLLFCGADVNLNIQGWSNPTIGYSFLFALAYLVFSFVMTTSIFFLKWHKEDNFTFALATNLVIIVFVLLGYGITNKSAFWIALKFFIGLCVAAISSVLGVVITSLFKNIKLKIDEKQNDLVKRYQEGGVLTPRQMKNMKKIEELKITNEAKIEKQEMLRQEISKKLSDKFVLEEQKRIEKSLKSREKIDQKEIKDKQRRKEQDDKVEF